MKVPEANAGIGRPEVFEIPEISQKSELDVSGLSGWDAKDIERSKVCRKTCPGAEKCPFGGWRSFSSEYRGRVSLTMDRCVVFRIAAERKRIERLIPSSRVLGRLEECTFSTFLTEGAHKSVILAKRLAFQAAETGKTIVLAGETGVGKTHLAAALMRRVLTKDRLAVFLPFGSFLNDLRSTFSAGKDPSQIFETLRKAACLVLDDVGQEVKTDYSDACLYEIVNERYNARSQLVVTTNYPSYESLAKASSRGPYIVRRLQEMGRWVRIESGRSE